MKKYFPFIIGGLVLVLLIVLILTDKSKPSRRMDERITLKQQDKIPYGTRVARELLSSLFPNANVSFDRNSPPGFWDSIEVKKNNQAVILVTDYFDADKGDLGELSRFVERGNYVFIIARSASDNANSFFNVSFKSNYYYESTPDSLQLKLESPSFSDNALFTYPGKNYEGYFTSVDKSHTVILGSSKNGQPDFIQLNKGRGSFFIHAAPLAFSNYFILHKNNVAYYEQALSVLPKNISTVLWNEYYLQKPSEDEPNRDEPNWLGALLSYPPFKWGLLVGAITLLLYILLGMRRRQRMIPPHERPKNDSLDFVKTLGRLYYDKKDHRNLAIKMAAYFLEHVRSVYKLPTHSMDETFIKALHFKSSYPEAELERIIQAIEKIKDSSAINEMQLSDFHKQLELFYQNT